MTTIDDHYFSKVGDATDICEHLPTLKRYAEQCQHVTEFGVRGVVSTWAFLAARPIVLRSYDIIDCDVTEPARLAKEDGIDFQFIKGDTREITIEPTDLLFIDTLHTYAQLSKELRRHEANVKKFILIHDTETFGYHDYGSDPKHSKGLRPAIKDFTAANPQWRTWDILLNCNGLTVLERVKA